MQPKRIIISLLVVILALFSAGMIVSAEDSTVLDLAVEVSSSTALSNKVCAVEIGDEVTASVTIKSNPGVLIAVFDLLYDPDVLDLKMTAEGKIKLDEGTLFEGASCSAVVIEAGHIRYSVIGSKNYDGTGMVFTCKFNAKAHGTAEIVLDMEEDDAGFMKPDGTGQSVSEVNIVYGEDPTATAGYALVHDFGEAVTVAPTCTETGKDLYTCTTCNETYTVSNGTPALGHTKELIPSTQATCMTDGMTQGEKCSVCGEILLAPVVVEPKSDEHHVIVIDPAVAATCTATGLTQGSHCSVCNTVMIAQEEVAMIEHDYDEGTENDDGTVTKTCNSCGHTVTEDASDDGDSMRVLLIVLIVVVSVVVVAAAVAVIIILTKKSKNVV